VTPALSHKRSLDCKKGKCREIRTATAHLLLISHLPLPSGNKEPSSDRPHPRPPFPLPMASTFETLVARLTRDASRAQPRDPLQWCSNWFQHRLEEQRTRSRGELARLPSYRTSLPNGLYVDAPIQSNRQRFDSSTTETVSPYPRGPPRHLPSPPNLKGPSPFGILDAPGNALLAEDSEDSLTSPSIPDIEPTSPVGPALGPDLYSTHQNTRTSPAPSQSSRSGPADILPPVATILSRRLPSSAESIVVDGGTTETFSVFPEISDQPRRIRNSIASNYIFRAPDEEQETEELNASQEVRLEAEEIVIRQGDLGEQSHAVEIRHLNCYIRPEPLPSPWISGKPSSTSLTSEGKGLQPGSPQVQPPTSPPGPLALSPIANSFIDPQLLYGVCGSFVTTLERWSVIDDLDPSSQRSGSTHLRSPASKRRSKARSQMSSLSLLEGLCPSASRHPTGVIF